MTGAVKMPAAVRPLSFAAVYFLIVAAYLIEWRFSTTWEDWATLVQLHEVLAVLAGVSFGWRHTLADRWAMFAILAWAVGVAVYDGARLAAMP